MRRAMLLIMRALLLRCPGCGAGDVFRTMFKLRQRCPGCDLQLEREAGYFTGAMTINLVTTELVWVASFVALLVATWPNPPWTLLQWGSVALMLLFLVVYFPHSKMLWLAFDLYFRPIERPGAS